MIYIKSIFISLFFIISSCQINRKTNFENISGQLSYFKDDRTGICFAVINSASYVGFEITSITQVPCDSIKKILTN